MTSMYDIARDRTVTCPYCKLSSRTEGERCVGCCKPIANEHEWFNHGDADCDECEVCTSLCWNRGKCEPADGWAAEVQRLRAELLAEKARVEHMLEAARAACRIYSADGENMRRCADSVREAVERAARRKR